jgi:hypothetical protein
MKYMLILSSLLLIGNIGTSAQTIKLDNQTSCTLTLKLRSAKTSTCTILNSSPYIVINPSQSINAPLSSFMTAGPTDWLIQCDFFNWSCSAAAAFVGYMPCGVPGVAVLNMGTCCPAVTATYSTIGVPGAVGSVQTVVFN